MIKKLVALWAKIPPSVKNWLKGAEVAVVTAVIAAFAVAPASDFSTKKGIAEFAAVVASSAYAALRLYLTQSPVQNVVKEVVQENVRTVAIGDLSKTTSSSTTVTTTEPPKEGV